MVARSNPPALGMQLDRCDVCGDKVHRRELVRTQVVYGIPVAENYLIHSSFNTDSWAIDDASDAGMISYGNHCDRARLLVPSSQPTAAGGMSVLNGVQTWEGSGTIRTFIRTTDLLDAGYLVFSAQVGPHEENEDPEMTVSLGICSEDGVTKQEIRSWTIRTMKRVWWVALRDDLREYGLDDGNNDYFYYIQVTNDGKWWADEMQVEAISVTEPRKPGTFVETNGALVRQTEGAGISTRKVCPNCFETVYRWSEVYHRTEEVPVDDPVTEFTQEF